MGQDAYAPTWALGLAAGHLPPTCGRTPAALWQCSPFAPYLRVYVHPWVLMRTSSLEPPGSCLPGTHFTDEVQRGPAV